MSEQQVSREQFFISQQIESLARQNAQQATRIAQLEAELMTIRAENEQKNKEAEADKEIQPELLPGEEPPPPDKKSH